MSNKHTNTLNEAKKYTKKGYVALPITFYSKEINKGPKILNWQNHTHTNLANFRSAKYINENRMNIGLRMNRVVFCVDLDKPKPPRTQDEIAKKDGLAFFLSLIKQHTQYETIEAFCVSNQIPLARSRSGGYHLIFKNTANYIQQHICIGGYSIDLPNQILVYPSKFRDLEAKKWQCYKWITVLPNISEVPEAPEWIQSAITQLLSTKQPQQPNCLASQPKSKASVSLARQSDRPLASRDRKSKDKKSKDKKSKDKNTNDHIDVKRGTSEYSYIKELVCAYLDCLDLHKRDTYDEWNKIGFIIKNCGLSVKTYANWSKKSPKYKEGECEQRWAKYPDGKKFEGFKANLTTLRNMAIADGGNISNIFDVKYEIGKLFVHFSPADVADLIHQYAIYKKMLGQYVCTQTDSPYNIYYYDGLIYNRDNSGNRILRGFFKPILKGLCELYTTLYTPTKRQQKTLIKLQYYGRTPTQLKSLLLFYSQHMYDVVMAKKMDNNGENVIVFKNGYYDFDTMAFVKRCDNTRKLLVTKALTYDYPENKDLTEEKNYIYNEVLNKIYPIEEQRQYVLNCYSILLGTHSYQKVINHVGDGANGKTVISKLLSHCLDEYTKLLAESEIVKSRQNGTGLNSTLKSLRGMKLCYTSETNSNEIDETKIKTISGGDEVAPRSMCRDEFERFECFAKVHIYTNKPLRYDSTEVSMQRRLVNIKYHSTFVFDDTKVDEKRYIYRANSDINKKLHSVEMLQAFMSILIDNYKPKFNIPLCVTKDTTELNTSMNDILNYLNENIVECANEYIGIRELYNNYRSDTDNRNYRLPEFKKKIIKMYPNNYFERKNLNGKYCRNILYGFRFTNDD